jgi:hypothetical protein
MQTNSGTAEGEGFSIARRFIPAVSLVIYKVSQFGGNSLQSVARPELLEKSPIYRGRPDFGRLTFKEL